MTRTAILFDLDGTLVDTAADLGWALNQVLGDIGRGPLSIEEVRGMIGGGIVALVALGLEATGGPVEESQLEDMASKCKVLYNEHIADQSLPYPGVPETLPILAGMGVRMGVCTNKPESASRKLLSELGIDSWLPVVIGGDSLPVRKPDPQMANAVMNQLGISKEQAVLVGDSITDVELARGAGLPVILVSYGFSNDPIDSLGADKIITDFSMLEECIKSFKA